MRRRRGLPARRPGARCARRYALSPGRACSGTPQGTRGDRRNGRESGRFRPRSPGTAQPPGIVPQPGAVPRPGAARATRIRTAPARTAIGGTATGGRPQPGRPSAGGPAQTATGGRLSPDGHRRAAQPGRPSAGGHRETWASRLQRSAHGAPDLERNDPRPLSRRVPQQMTVVPLRSMVTMSGQTLPRSATPEETVPGCRSHHGYLN
jgi:hypothetical protein